MANASVHIMNIDKNIYDSHTSPMCNHINVGSGEDLTIKELSQIIKEVVDYQGYIDFDTSKPDGTPRKFLYSKLLNNLGWHNKISLRDGLLRTYRDFIKNYGNL